MKPDNQSSKWWRSPIFWNRVISGFSLIVCIGAIAAVYQGLKDTDWQLVWENLNQISLGQLGLALICVVCSYGAITWYDILAFRYIKRKLALRKIILAGLINYAISPNVGVAFLSGSILRYRLYRRWQVPNFDIAKIIAFTNLSAWVGLIPISGLIFTVTNFPLPELLTKSLALSSPKFFGVILLIISGIYWSILWKIKQPITWRGNSLQLPSLEQTFQQTSIFFLDWGFAALTLYLLVDPPLSPFIFFGIYIMAMVAGLISSVPGGLGVFETVILFFLEPLQPKTEILASLLVFRSIYYFLPFSIGVLALLIFEMNQRLVKS